MVEKREYDLKSVAQMLVADLRLGIEYRRHEMSQFQMAYVVNRIKLILESSQQCAEAIERNDMQALATQLQWIGKHYVVGGNMIQERLEELVDG